MEKITVRRAFLTIEALEAEDLKTQICSRMGFDSLAAMWAANPKIVTSGGKSEAEKVALEREELDEGWE
jgi:hypothetical protein